MAGTDKVTRILMLYTRLSEGGKIYKQSFCADMDIDRRTFDRDIEDIRLFLSEAYLGDELVYDRRDDSYHLKNRYAPKVLSGMDLVYVLECLWESRTLREDEFKEVISNIVDIGERRKMPLIRAIAERYIKNYQNSSVKEALMKLQWDLQQCVAENDVIQLCMLDGTEKRVLPVALRIYAGEMYLCAYNKQNELIVIKLTEIESFRMRNSKFDRKWIEMFDQIEEKQIAERIKETYEKY